MVDTLGNVINKLITVDMKMWTNQKLPKYWVIWPHSESKGWCDRLTGQLNHNSVS